MRLGIDFGTCFSSAAFMDHGTLTLIKDPIGLGYSVPSSVFITLQEQILVGRAANNQRLSDPTRYRRDLKRDLGRRLPLLLGGHPYRPEVLITSILSKIKHDADTFMANIGLQASTGVVLAIPSTYQQFKRDLMHKAAVDAGFIAEEVTLLEEPVAAALYYAQKSKMSEGEILLVYDLGGGTFDTSLLQKRGAGFEYLAPPTGIERCGGVDFDRAIYNDLVKQNPELQSLLRGERTDKPALMTRLSVGEMCVELKHQLSETEEAEITFAVQETGNFIEYSLTRNVFNHMITPSIQETLTCCEVMLQQANISAEKISSILLVGGSCRIPYVQLMLQQQFRRPLVVAHDLELVVCQGAAFYASPNEGPTSLPVREITPEHVIASLPIDAQDAARSAKAATVRSALDAYHAIHRNERLIIQDDYGLFYYDNIVQVTYIWQIWQILSKFVAVHEISQLVPLFQELLSSLSSSLNTSLNAPIEQAHSPSFFFTTLNTQHVFANLNMPRQIPIIFYTAPSFDTSQNNELHQLLMDISPLSRFAILLFFTKPKYFHESQGFLKQFQMAYAYDVIPMACKEFLQITEAREPGKVFRQWILSQADLRVISPFTTSGPTPEGMFFGREQELRTIREHIRTASYALIGGRRIGKTSILKHLWRIGLPKIGIQAFYQDCSNIQTQMDLVQAVSLDLSWSPVSPSAPFLSLAHVIQALPHDQPITLLLDEADKFIEPDKSAGYPLLNTLRALANAGRCQFVFGGEYALLNDMKNPRSPLYNFANVLLVGHLDTRAVRELIVQPLRDLEIELEDEQEIVELIRNFTAGHPNVIQRLCQRLVMKFNGSHRLRLNREDVERVITNVDFLRNDFLDTYWGQATLLERLCTLVMAKEQSICTLVNIHTALSSLALDTTLSDVNEALEGLVNLRNLLQRTPQGYVFAVKGFSKVIGQTYELDDLIALTCEKYRQAKAQHQWIERGKI